ncbi:MAG: DUF86 domain-containing protein [Acidobacteria bacterium]|nr:DUF86 domain-containing protein [Acidobacteriota bacterium]
MVDSNVVLKRIGQIRKCVAQLESIRRTHSKEQFLKNDLIKAAAERNIQIAVQSVLDICNHVVADRKLEVPDEEKHAVRILASHKIIPLALAKTLGGMAGVRNILVHEYLEVDHGRLYTIMSRNLGDFGKFIRVILKLL